jgi:hypothetical protein
MRSTQNEASAPGHRVEHAAMDERLRLRPQVLDARRSTPAEAWAPSWAADDWADAADRLEAAQAWYQAVLTTDAGEPTVTAARQDLLLARERVDGLQRRWIGTPDRRTAA